jgi:hypothetical protein
MNEMTKCHNQKGDFMKKQLTVAFGLMVLAAPAFATKARLEALGEDNYGSYYVNDNRNMFLNPARINDHKDVVNYEFGASGNGASAAADSAAAPKAEGGFTKGHGNMVYGVQFGNTTPTAALVRTLTGNNSLSERQPMDLFVGGDAGVKWGANVSYENFDSGRSGSAARVASNALRTRLGVVLGDLDVFAHISLQNSAKDFQGNSVKGNIGYLLGAAYTLNNYRLIAEWRQIGAKYQSTANTAGANDKFDYNQIRLGVARQERLNDKATLFAKVLAVRQDVNDKGGFTGATTSASPATTGLGVGNGWTGAGKANSVTVPLTLGTEYNATSWLDLRASVSQNLYSSAMTKPSNGSRNYGSVANTAVRAGASLKFGDFSVDGLISTNNDVAGTGDTTTGAGKGNLRTDQLMSRVSMIYRF